MKRCTTLLVIIVVVAGYAFSQRADLSGITICIDPGHGGHNAANDRHIIPDPGTDFWESESNFQTALLLKALLETKGATVVLTRNTNDYPDDNLEPSLTARVTLANQNNANWFHSIHSNATALPLGGNLSTNYTLMLIREKRPGGPSSSSGDGQGVPEMQESWDISTIIGPKIVTKLRTQRNTQYLDWTFYGATNGGFSLGVLRGLSMPGELSEAAFHDYYPATRRLMNNNYRKMEAYAIRDAFLQYYSVPADTLSQIAGIVSEARTGKMIDGLQVRLLPENVVFIGDFYHNGFYMFDGIRAGAHWIRFETPGFRRDSVQVNVGIGTTAFMDRPLDSLTATSVELPSETVLVAFELQQNYPNPFNPTTNIEFRLPARQTDVGLASQAGIANFSAKGGSPPAKTVSRGRAGASGGELVTLKVFDVLGREIAGLVNDIRPAGKYTVRWNGRNDRGEPVSSGIYLYQLKSGSLTETKRMILLK